MLTQLPQPPFLCKFQNFCAFSAVVRPFIIRWATGIPSYSHFAKLKDFHFAIPHANSVEYTGLRLVNRPQRASFPCPPHLLRNASHESGILSVVEDETQNKPLMLHSCNLRKILPKLTLRCCWHKHTWNRCKVHTLDITLTHSDKQRLLQGFRNSIHCAWVSEREHACNCWRSGSSLIFPTQWIRANDGHCCEVPASSWEHFMATPKTTLNGTTWISPKRKGSATTSHHHRAGVCIYISHFRVSPRLDSWVWQWVFN